MVGMLDGVSAISKRARIRAAIIVGMAMSIANFAALSRSSPSRRPAVMVTPERLVPGMSARH